MTIRSATKTLVTDTVQAIVTASLGRGFRPVHAVPARRDSFAAACVELLGMEVPEMTVVGTVADQTDRNEWPSARQRLPSAEVDLPFQWQVPVAIER